MKYEEIEKLYNQLEMYIDKVNLGPNQDKMLNKLTELSDLMDQIDTSNIESKSQELLNDNETKELDNLVKSSLSDLENLTVNINKVTKIIGSIDKVINKVARFV